LGLAISQQLVQMVGSDIIVQSNLGQGSIFSLQRSPVDIIPPPAAEMTVLLDLAMMGDLKSILEQTAKIKALDRQNLPFALHLRQLAKGYKERQILEFVKKYAGV
jgi:predicted Fe-Mo cluster-binding NifX family protein